MKKQVKKYIKKDIEYLIYEYGNNKEYIVKNNIVYKSSGTKETNANIINKVLNAFVLCEYLQGINILQVQF